MIELFRLNRTFNTDIGFWDTSNVTNMNGMFSGAQAFNNGGQTLNNWDTSSVTNMRNMFSSTNIFNQDISAWDVSSVTTMYYMFSGAYRFNQDISAWDVSSVTDMNSMFYFAEDFVRDLTGWCVSNISTFPRDFDYRALLGMSYSYLRPVWGTALRQPQMQPLRFYQVIQTMSLLGIGHPNRYILRKHGFYPAYFHRRVSD